MAKVHALSRTYAQAVAGVPVTMKFDRQFSSFELSFKYSKVSQFFLRFSSYLRQKAKGSTEIYYNSEWHYPAGVSVVIDPPNALTWVENEKNYLSFFANSILQDGDYVTIQLDPK